MYARSIVVVAVLSLVVAWMSAVATPPAQAEWYRPLTWGEKKPAARPTKKNTGIVGGTKQALAKTADVLTPWDNKKKKDNPHDGAARFFRPDVAHRKQENEASWYRPATWFRSEPEPKKPLTVTDWMALDRPEFENR